MGWTGTSVMNMSSYWDYSKNKYDFKAFLDNQYNCENETFKWELLKSSMVGNTWYGAIKRIKKETGEFEVYGETILTSKQGNWFYQKEVSEDMGPFSLDCPVNILNLLTPTDSKYANQWRKKCVANSLYKQHVSQLWKRAKDKQQTAFLRFVLPCNMSSTVCEYKKGEVVYLSYGTYRVKGKLTNCWTDGMTHFKRKDIDIFKCVFIAPDKSEFIPIIPNEVLDVINCDYDI